MQRTRFEGDSSGRGDGRRVLVVDTDDAQLLGIGRLFAIVLAAFEADHHVDVDVLALQVSDKSGRPNLCTFIGS